MAKQKADEKILSYKDVVLRQSDLDILSGPYFLNDQIIEFYFSYLESCYPSEDILLVPPSITFWIKECPDSGTLQDFIEPLHLSSRKLIIFPINDNTNLDIAGGGSHWSLLAFSRDANVFVHHDSSGMGMNKAHAERVFKVVDSYMDCGADYVECSSTPVQPNGYDCGLYVIAIARCICCWYKSDGPKDAKNLWCSVVEEQVSPSVVSQMRNSILELIRSLEN